jgi:hypothetical protein
MIYEFLFDVDDPLYKKFIKGSIIGKTCQSQIACTGVCDCPPAHSVLNLDEMKEFKEKTYNYYKEALAFSLKTFNTSPFPVDNDEYTPTCHHITIWDDKDISKQIKSFLHNNNIKHDIIVYRSHIDYEKFNTIICYDIDVYIILYYMMEPVFFRLSKVPTLIYDRIKFCWFECSYTHTPLFTDWYVMSQKNFKKFIYFKNYKDFIFYKMGGE